MWFANCAILPNGLENFFSALQKMNAMEVSLSKASKAYPDCSAMASKLRAMTYNTEEQLRAQKGQVSYLTQLAARTFPKGLHCLSMKLTSEYFSLQFEEREFPRRQNVQNLNLNHYAIFSDNILACAVVVNSTVSTSKVRNSHHPSFCAIWITNIFPSAKCLLFDSFHICNLWLLKITSNMQSAFTTFPLGAFFCSNLFYGM